MDNILLEGFGTLEHVTNLYSLYGFIFLATILAIGVNVKTLFIKVYCYLVFVRARADRRALINTTSSSWEEYIENLENDKKVEMNVVASKIKDIPFVKFRVKVNDVEDELFKSRFFFKGASFCIPLQIQECAVLQVQIEKIYNTKHFSSGEPE